MVVAAAEERGDNLVQGRGDAYCGMLNASYNLKLRNLKAYIPEYPVGTPEEVAEMIADFAPIARALVAVKNLKIISFGPRPQNFLACNAPIKRLYDLGVEIEENSELDLFESYKNHADDPRIPDVVKDMESELGEGNMKPEILPKLAQYEITLLDWVEAHKGCRKYVTLTTKCWPASQKPPASMGSISAGMAGAAWYFPRWSHWSLRWCSHWAAAGCWECSGPGCSMSGCWFLPSVWRSPCRNRWGCGTGASSPSIP